MVSVKLMYDFQNRLRAPVHKICDSFLPPEGSTVLYLRFATHPPDATVVYPDICHPNNNSENHY